MLVFLSNLGGAWVGLGEYRLAEDGLRWTIRWAEIVGQGRWLSGTYRFLAEACLGQGKVEEAMVAARRALALGQEVKAPAFIGGAWRILGMVVAQAEEPIAVGGKTYDAVACFAESMRIFTEMGAEGERAHTLRAWARYELERGDREKGEAMWQEAQDLFARLGTEMAGQAAEPTCLSCKLEEK